MVLGLNPTIDDTLNLPCVGCCGGSQHPEVWFGSPWRVLRLSQKKSFQNFLAWRPSQVILHGHEPTAVRTNFPRVNLKSYLFSASLACQNFTSLFVIMMWWPYLSGFQSNFLLIFRHKFTLLILFSHCTLPSLMWFIFITEWWSTNLVSKSFTISSSIFESSGCWPTLGFSDCYWLWFCIVNVPLANRMNLFHC